MVHARSHGNKAPKQKVQRLKTNGWRAGTYEHARLPDTTCDDVTAQRAGMCQAFSLGGLGRSVDTVGTP